MTRPLRLEFSGALYHITSRGDRKVDIYRDDTDRAVWLQTLGDVCSQSNFSVHAFCQMSNHYHLLLETADGNLSQGMRQLNGVYSQYFNRRHQLVGHLFQGRYHAILVQKEEYLLELARYIVLNPVRAKMIASPEDWRWSSYHLTTASAPAPAWLDTGSVLARFDSRRPEAVAAYQQFVLAGLDTSSPLNHTQNRLLLGDAEFIERFRSPPASPSLNDISKVQRSAFALSLSAYQKKYADRNEAMAHAYATNAYTIIDIARHFSVSRTTVSRAVSLWRQRRPKTELRTSSCSNGGPDPGV